MNTQNCSTIIALFVRIPVPGRVKTRLASDLGNENACRLYRAMVSDILRNIEESGFPVYLFHDGADCGELPHEWVKASSGVIVQHGDSIGERMATAFQHCFAENIAKVILVGSDIPGLDSQVITEASDALESHDVAIAPAADGGYCLIALRRDIYQRNIFRNIPWSTGQVLHSTLERCTECHLQVALLKQLLDIDTIHDIQTYCKNPSAHAIATNICLEAAGFLL